MYNVKTTGKPRQSYEAPATVRMAVNATALICESLVSLDDLTEVEEKW